MRYGDNLLAGFIAEDGTVFRNFIRITPTNFQAIKLWLSGIYRAILRVEMGAEMDNSQYSTQFIPKSHSFQRNASHENPRLRVTFLKSCYK
jgi:hypothetical protein